MEISPDMTSHSYIYSRRDTIEKRFTVSRLLYSYIIRRLHLHICIYIIFVSSYKSTWGMSSVKYDPCRDSFGLVSGRRVDDEYRQDETHSRAIFRDVDRENTSLPL